LTERKWANTHVHSVHVSCITHMYMYVYVYQEGQNTTYEEFADK